MATIRAGEIDIEYYLEGSGSPLLLLAGVGSHAGSWGEPFLQAIREQFQIVRLSNRGMGGTGIVDGQLTIRTMADDAAGLMKRLNIASAHVFGFSMGGYIAQELAAHYPQMVQRLVLGCTNCGPARSIPQTPDEIDRLGKVMAASPNDQVRGFCMAMVAEDFAARAPQFMEDMVTAHRSTQMEAFSRQMGAISAFDFFDDLPLIKAPTLLIHGDQDLIIQHGNAALLAERIPDARFQIIPGAGHMFMWERPRETSDAVAAFLAGVKSPG